jgi:hypothetical protein
VGVGGDVVGVVVGLGVGVTVGVGVGVSDLTNSRDTTVIEGASAAKRIKTGMPRSKKRSVARFVISVEEDILNIHCNASGTDQDLFFEAINTTIHQTLRR